MASNKRNEDTPPQDDPRDPNYICTNCHTNVFELCDSCIARIDVQEILEKIKRNKGKESTKSPKTTPATASNDTQNISENEITNNDPPDSPSLLENNTNVTDTNETESDPPVLV